MDNDELLKHKFWSNQPVASSKSSKPEDATNEPIENITNANISHTPIKLPDGYEWSVLDINDEKTLNELYDFLKNNYIEDEHCIFMMEYSKNLLKWSILKPDYFPECVLGIRTSSNHELLASIIATPDEIKIREKQIKIVIVDFLCIVRSLRSKRMSPVLIREIKRRSHLRGIFQALHTGAINLPSRMANPVYFHRFLNPKKLLDSGFATLPVNTKLSFYLKIYKTPEKVSTSGFQKMTSDDSNAVSVLLNNYSSRFKLSKVFTEEYVRTSLVPVKDVIYSYVVKNDGIVTDFISFFALDVRSERLKPGDALRVCMIYYHACSSTDLSTIFNDLIVEAKKEQFDVINCLNIMETEKMFKNLHFVAGSGILNYYLFNWKCAQFSHEEIGVYIV